LFAAIFALSPISAARAQSGYSGSAQTQTVQNPSATNQKKHKKDQSTLDDVGGGVGSAAGGVAKGAGSAATGVAKGAGDLVTLHPIGAGESVGTGAVKGVGKVGKGVGHAFRKIL
jgi:hypothetical protein